MRHRPPPVRPFALAAALGLALAACHGDEPVVPEPPDPAAWAQFYGDGGVEVADGMLSDMEPPPTCSTGNGPASRMTIINGTRGGIDRFWVDYQCNEVSYGRIARGERATQDSFVGHVWRFRDDDGDLLREVVLSASPEETVELP